MIFDNVQVAETLRGSIQEREQQRDQHVGHLLFEITCQQTLIIVLCNQITILATHMNKSLVGVCFKKQTKIRMLVLG